MNTINNDIDFFINITEPHNLMAEQDYDRWFAIYNAYFQNEKDTQKHLNFISIMHQFIINNCYYNHEILKQHNETIISITQKIWQHLKKTWSVTYDINIQKRKISFHMERYYKYLIKIS